MKYLIAGALALVIAEPALAQTAGPVRSGVRVEGRMGWDRPVFKEKLVADGVVATRKSGKSGVVWGAEAGYDYVTSGRMMIGGYAGIEGSTAEACTGPDRFCRDLGRNITVGARVGYVLRRGVVYLKGGYSNGRVTDNFDGPPPPPPAPGSPPPFPLVARDKRDFGGFHLGAGGEMMIGRNAYTKLEYVYTDYGTDKFRDTATDATLSFGKRRHQIVVGVGYRF